MHDYLTGIPLNYKGFVFKKQTTSGFSKEWGFFSIVYFDIFHLGNLHLGSIWWDDHQRVEMWLLISKLFQNTSLHPNSCIDFPIYLFTLSLWKFVPSLENVHKEIFC